MLTSLIVRMKKKNRPREIGKNLLKFDKGIALDFL
jgi:hypothetical protein